MAGIATAANDAMIMGTDINVWESETIFMLLYFYDD